MVLIKSIESHEIPSKGRLLGNTAKSAYVNAGEA